MVIVSPDIRSRFPNAFKKVRKERIRCVRLDVDLYYVARVALGHGRYIVRFFETPAINETKVKVQCRSIDGALCQGAWGDRLCAHAAAAIERGIKHGRKRRKVAA